MQPGMPKASGEVPRQRCGWSLAAVVTWAMVAVVGCGGASPGAADDPAASSVGRLARLIERYRIDHRGQLPRSEQDLRRFAGAIAPADLATLGVTNVEACFTSDRDGQPLGLPFARRDAVGAEAGVICYERQGRDGLRLVGTVGGNVEIADAARFAELVPTP